MLNGSAPCAGLLSRSVIATAIPTAVTDQIADSARLVSGIVMDFVRYRTSTRDGMTSFGSASPKVKRRTLAFGDPQFGSRGFVVVAFDK